MMNIQQLFAGLVVDDDSHLAHTQVVRHLQARGWACQREYPAPGWGNGHAKFIDILAVRDGLRMAIEIDRKSPRQKSLRKLRDVEADIKVALLRRGTTRQCVDGIEVLSLEAS